MMKSVLATLRRSVLFLVPSLAAIAAFAPRALAQGAPERGPRRVDPRWHALVHATLVPRPGVTQSDATIVVRDGVIVSVETGGAPPPGARVWDASGLTVYAGLVEPYFPVDAPRDESDGPGAHWGTPVVSPERSALDGAGVPADARKELRNLGFGAAAIAPNDGVIRGRGAVVSLGDAADELSAASAEVIARDVYQAISFRPAGFRGRDAGGPSYPTSEMGAIALVRQVLLDADHQERCLEVYARDPEGHEPPVESRALRALGRNGNGGTPLLFDARDELQVLRAARVAAEFGRAMIVKGSGDEFRRLEAVAKTDLPILCPLEFPERPDVSTPAKADVVSLRELMTWEQAPTNARRLVAAGVTVAFTTDGLAQKGDFYERLRKAIAHGLDEDDALAMLTTVPAKLLGLSDRLGAVAPGMLANLVVTDGELFAKDTKVRDVWVGGRRYEVNAAPDPDKSGAWTITFAKLGEHDGAVGELEIGKKKDAKLAVLDKELDAKSLELDAQRLSFQLDGKQLGVEGRLVVAGLFDGEGIYGEVVGPDGASWDWYAVRAPEKAADESESPESASGETKGETASADALPAEPDAAAPAASGEEALVQAETPPAVEGEPVPELARRHRGHREAGAPPRRAAPQDAEHPDAEGEAVPPEDEEPGADESKREGDEEEHEAPEEAPSVPETYGVPFGAFGLHRLPEQRTVRIDHARIWTSGPKGILDDATLVIDKGRVRYVGEAAGAPDVVGIERIDARGKQITPGLIDCHSHTGISGGVNEMGQRVTAEVRVQDVIDPDDVSFYDQLAGGLTGANQLHGSGNAIGGQNSVVKLRWGVPRPDDMRFVGAPGGIKFALGENPKRVASETQQSEEYPQTRLGVEALIRDRLHAGRDYGAEWAAYDALSEWQRRNVMPPRRDLELEALSEVVSGKRLIHCHSYRQDEILMLCRLTQELGIQIGTFQHVLEGYKVAEAIRDAALGASTFADWWAYKFEVIDAIPYNAAIMSEVGVCVSINSDSDEHARRLNTEAGKCMKYGGMSPEEALKLVTLNPAIQLAISDRVGSLEPGKDADFAIWSGDPLSYASRCEATWIDGREYFSLEEDRALREEARAERNRIVQKILREGSPSRGPRGARRGHGEDPTPSSEEGRALDEAEALWRAGIDPDRMEPGDCGCGLSRVLETER